MADETATAAKPCRVRVRMYRQGIGDAFLLSFYTGPEPRHILIDCGMLTGTPDARQWAEDICGDIARETAGGRLDAIVGTHPHWDHLSGFWDARESFDKLAKNEVWLAWSENPRDSFAAEHRRQRSLQLDGAQEAVRRLAASPDPAASFQAAMVGGVLAFQGPEIPGVAKRGTDAALDALRALVPEPRYWLPGDLITRDWLPGVRIYVLGPPRDEKLLAKLLGRKGSEMYGLGTDSGFFAALLGQGPGGQPPADALGQMELACPFDGQLRWPRTEPGCPPAAALAEVEGRYGDPADDWRTIDDAWLHGADQLSLLLDNAVNNLSLVLAFELVDTGEVLLFPGDAQVGNWLSWSGLSWAVEERAGQDRTVTAADLLARTVFYKVGHHGSHNATLMEGGLEAMTHPDLVAAIPVKEAFAEQKGWEMPAQVLYRRLLEKTRGRIIRADGSGPTLSDPARPPDLQVCGEFKARVTLPPGGGGLYVDYRLP
ncbi:MAG TPA: MBL fold metallo-hydrolase [Rhodocyclaceae bacterium]|nr:MBL fold metallo-hydrolase [Rhodocyclaceae bacterium]